MGGGGDFHCSVVLNVCSYVIVLLLQTGPSAQQGYVRPRLTMESLNIKTLVDTHENLKIECGTPDPLDPRVKGVKSLHIERTLNEERDFLNRLPPGQILVQASDEGDYQATHEAGTTNYSVGGALSESDIEANIFVYIKVAGCWDSGVYTCKMVYYTDDAKEHTDIATRDMFLEVRPTDLTMKKTSKFNELKSGQTLTLTCGGNVGTIHTITRWQWQYRNPVAKKGDDGSWITFFGKKLDKPEPEKEGCFKRTYSTLEKKIIDDDSAREYRCFIQKGEIMSRLDSYIDQALVVALPNFLEKQDSILTTGLLVGAIVTICLTVFAIVSMFGILRHQTTKAPTQEIAIKAFQKLHEQDPVPTQVPSKPILCGQFLLDEETDVDTGKVFAKLRLPRGAVRQPAFIGDPIIEDGETSRGFGEQPFDGKWPPPESVGRVSAAAAPPAPRKATETVKPDPVSQIQKPSGAKPPEAPKTDGTRSPETSGANVLKAPDAPAKAPDAPAKAPDAPAIAPDAPTIAPDAPTTTPKLPEAPAEVKPPA